MYLFPSFYIHCIVVFRGVCGAVWFSFEVKSHPSRKINMYAVWFGSVDFTNKIRTKPNQTNAVWIRSVGAVF